MPNSCPGAPDGDRRRARCRLNDSRRWAAPGSSGNSRRAIAGDGVAVSGMHESAIDHERTVAVRCVVLAGRRLSCAAVQPRPTAAELLAIVAEVLERDIVPALDGPVQHHARVAANLVAIVERELRLAPGAAIDELAAVDSLLHDRPGRPRPSSGPARHGAARRNGRRSRGGDEGVGRVDEGGS